MATTFTETELHEHAIQLGALGMCGINQPLWETRQKIELYLTEHFLPRHARSEGTATPECPILRSDADREGA